MTTVRLYKSAVADSRVRVRYGQKHGRPRGRGRKAWRLLYRLTLHPENLGRRAMADSPARSADTPYPEFPQ